MLTDNEFSFTSLLQGKTTYNSIVVALLSKQRFIITLKITLFAPMG